MLLFIAERLTCYREQRGWTKLKLSQEANLSSSHISQIEKGIRTPNRITLDKLSQALGVPVEAFLDVNRIGHNIKQIRTSKGLTMSDVEFKAGLSRGHLSKIEKGQRAKPSQETLSKISLALGVQLRTVLEGYSIQAI